MAKNDLKELLQDLDRLAVNLTFNGRARAAEEIVKDLQDLSPAWTGKFRNSWFIETPDGTKAGGQGTPGQAMPVQAPKISGIQSATALFNRVFGTSGAKRLFTVGNSASYADQATDLAPYVPGKLPAMKASTKFGRKYGVRPVGAERGNLSAAGPTGPGAGNSSSAPLDWFSHYQGSGKADEAVKRAYSKGFKGFRR
tara:strand:+ start:424 stop:1014 length:591 start_codon:yes stop_codon:yes gene_type:complete